jgi:hypothetical protein
MATSSMPGAPRPANSRAPNHAAAAAHPRRRHGRAHARTLRLPERARAPVVGRVARVAALPRRGAAAAGDANDILSIGMGGRVVLSPKFTVVADYQYIPAGQTAAVMHKPLTIGLDINTGGHVFQRFHGFYRAAVHSFYIENFYLVAPFL